MNNYTIELAKQEDLKIYYKMSPDEINKGYETYYKQSSEYFFVGKLGDQIISKIFCIKFLKNYAAIHGYFVKDEFRGKGYGVQIFKRAMDALKDFDCIKLVSVEQQKSNYEKWGFKSHCQIDVRYISQFSQVDPNRNTIIKTDINQINLKQFIQYDKKYVGYDREQILLQVLRNNHPFFSYDKITNKIVGYSCVSNFGQRFVINLMIAQNNQVAEDLVKEMMIFVRNWNEKMNSNHTLNLQSFQCWQHVIEFIRKWFPNFRKRLYLMFLNRTNIPISNWIVRNQYCAFRL